MTAGFPALAAHVVVARGADRDRIRQQLEMELGESFGIEHTTLQMEEEAEGGFCREHGRDEITAHGPSTGDGTLATRIASGKADCTAHSAAGAE